MSLELARAAFQRLVDALNRARDPALLRAAVSDDIALDRYAPGARDAAPIAESFAGIAEVERWFARMPPRISFALAGAPWLDGRDERGGDERGGDEHWGDEHWGIEYAYDAGDFHHGGLWLARLACDGRIAHLSHHPFALRELSGAPVAPHGHGGAGHTHGG